MIREIEREPDDWAIFERIPYCFTPRDYGNPYQPCRECPLNLKCAQPENTVDDLECNEK